MKNVDPFIILKSISFERPKSYLRIVDPMKNQPASVFLLIFILASASYTYVIIFSPHQKSVKILNNMRTIRSDTSELNFSNLNGGSLRSNGRI